MSETEKADILPDFQAIGTLAGTLAADDNGRYQLVTADGLSLKTFVRGKLLKRISEQSELLGQVRPWTVYPKTDRQGNLFYVYVVNPGGHLNRPVDQFHISGRVSVHAQEAGLIGVRIEPNHLNAQPPPEDKKALAGQSFPPFYINLHGYLPGDVRGEIWRFNCQRVGLHLEMIDGARVKGRESKAWPKKRQGAAAISPPRLKQSQG